MPLTGREDRITIFHVPHLFQQDGQPHQALWHLLEKTGISLDRALPASSLPDTIMQKTQDAWLRKPHHERWHLDQAIKRHHHDILSNLKELGVTRPIVPAYNQYDALCILGGAAPSMKKRIQHAVSLIESGISAQQIVILTGERPRSQERESRQQLAQVCDPELPLQEHETTPETEYEIAQFLLRHTQLSCASSLQVISSPAQPGSRRANTRDTAATFYAQHPDIATLLCISHQPYICYQHTVIKSVFSEYVHLETVGPADTVDQTPTDILLDTVARWIYAHVQQQ